MFKRFLCWIGLHKPDPQAIKVVHCTRCFNPLRQVEHRVK